MCIAITSYDGLNDIGGVIQVPYIGDVSQVPYMMDSVAGDKSQVRQMMDSVDC